MGLTVGTGLCNGQWALQWALVIAVGNGFSSGHWALQWGKEKAVHCPRCA